MYRASKLSRGAAWVVLACAAGVATVGLVTPGGASTMAIVMSGLFALAAWAALRLEVRATPDALIACNGRTTRRFPWPDVRGFEVDQQTGPEISVLLEGNARHRLRSSTSPPARSRPRTPGPTSNGTGERIAASAPR